MLEVEERDWENSLSLNSKNIYYDLNYGGLRRFSHDAASSSSANGRSIISCDDKVYHRQRCDICSSFKAKFIIEGIRDFRTTAGPIAPPSKLRRRRN